ncbi:MAG TPA: hypothetical protein VGX68_02255 [Thermoanaerobaculia bacterium]|jgi:uncharacterized membrane protein|nr:hypothetical protein [Thermoanaerobaculia bacterium]
MEPPRVEPPPPPAAPFDPSARPKSSGCPKPLIIGCLIIFLLGGVALLGAFYYMTKNASRVLQWSMQQMETGVMAQLPKDVTPEEKERLRQAFADVRQGLQDGRIPPEKLQPAQFKMMEIARKGSSLTRQDVLELTRALEEVAGTGGGTTGAESPPTP